MKIKPAPVIDFTQYLRELYAPEGGENLQVSNILELANNYYCSLTNHKSIIPVGGDFINDWCDLNNSEDISTCPLVEGILVYKNNSNGSRAYGVLYKSSHVFGQPHGMMTCFFIKSNGRMGAKAFSRRHWDGWGAPVRYFSFSEEEYIDTHLYSLGDRPLSIGSMGHDVWQLQALLHKVHEEIVINGYFTHSTLRGLHEVQTRFGLPHTNGFDMSQDDLILLDYVNGKLAKNYDD